MGRSGLMIGHFEPLHLGHVSSILHASGQVTDLHIVITPHPQPNPNFSISLKDKARWITQAFAHLPFIHVHLFPEMVIPARDADHRFLQIDKVNFYLERILEKLPEINQPLVLFIDEEHPLAKLELMLPVVTTPVQKQYHSSLIQQNPAEFWQAIHPKARSDYIKTVAIVGGESSGKTTLVHKLANYYGASYALEMGRVFVETDLGGRELSMQYDDYPLMAINHIQAIRQARQCASAPLVIVDTDFVTTQAFCEEYEGKKHPFLTACINEFHLDYTIMLSNNMPWIDDGLRSLGSDKDRKRFEQRLLRLFSRHHIQLFMVNCTDYHQRFLQVVNFIDKHIFNYN